MLQLQSFSKSYGGALIIQADHVFEPGLHWIRGENGSGKSTLFKAIAGLIPFQGKICIGDLEPARDTVAYRRSVNYSEAEPQYPGFVTAKDLVAFVSKVKLSSKRQTDYFVERFGVSRFLTQPCETCSSGMLKKISLTLSFLGNADVILLDEPLTTLDSQTQAILWEIVSQQIIEEKKTILVSSHHGLQRSETSMQHEYKIQNKQLILA